MKKVKELVWNDVVTELGKEKGFFHITATTQYLILRYHITNHLHGEIPNDKFYLEINYTCIECETLEYAKKIAQEDFEKKITEYFFIED